MLTAGLTAGLPTSILPQAIPGQTLGFADMLQANIVRNAIGASVSTALNGGNFGDNISNALINAAVQTLGAQAAIQIGAAAARGDINRGLQLAAHAALGCAIGAATAGGNDGGRGCVGGAVGGVVGEIVAGLYYDINLNRSSTLDPSKLGKLIEAGVDLAKLTGALAALGLGADVNAAIDTSGNAAQHKELVPKNRTGC